MFNLAESRTIDERKKETKNKKESNDHELFKIFFFNDSLAMQFVEGHSLPSVFLHLFLFCSYFAPLFVPHRPPHLSEKYKQQWL